MIMENMGENQMSLDTLYPSRLSGETSTPFQSQIYKFIDCEVIDYVCAGNNAEDPSNHVFTIRVWSERGGVQYIVPRSYDAFCRLDATLRKIFCKSDLPEMPLAQAGEYMKTMNSASHQLITSLSNTERPAVSSDAVRRLSKTSAGSSSSALRRVSGNFIKPDESESLDVLKSRRSLLTSYLQKLFALREVVISDALKMFLDEESPDGISSASDQVKSDAEIALLGEDYAIHQVGTTHRLRIPNENSEQVLAWSFSTESLRGVIGNPKGDIGFSICVGDQCVIPYQRHNSHEHAVVGMIEIFQPGEISLCWDNTYSRLRGKTLTYVYKLMSKEQYSVYQEVARGKAEEQHKFEEQRETIRKAIAEALKPGWRVLEDFRAETKSGKLKERRESIRPVLQPRLT
jgi:hypothetical protein